MSFMDTVEAKASDLMAEIRNVDHGALNALEVVLANPATADAFYTLGDLAHLPPQVLATGLDVLKMIRAVTPPPPPASIASDAQQAPLQPAGPVVAGQA